MFKNYLKIALRNLRKNKVYSFINIFGLAVGLACFILIIIFIMNELSYDKFHDKADRIYRPVEIQKHPGVGEQHVAVTPGPMAPAFITEFPEVEQAVRMMRSRNLFCKYGENGHYIDDIALVDSSIFNIFSIPFIEGDPKTALASRNNLVISEETAQKLFGDESPIGKVLHAEAWFGTLDFKISGIIKNYPRNSHLRFDMLGNFQIAMDQFKWLQNWGTNSLATYVLLKKNTNVAALEAKFPEMLQKYRPDVAPEEQMGLYLQPLQNIHLHSGHIRYQTYNFQQGNNTSIYIFSGIAALIILIACINFMNLATARSAKRAREVGIRKVMGSDRKKLVFQFVGESVILALIALFIGYLLVEMSFGYFEDLVDGRIISTIYHNIPFIIGLFGITLLVGVFAGSYPALYLSAFQPIATLKGELAKGSAGAILRKVLVVLQFSVAMALIASTGIIMDQVSYIQNKDLGFNKEQVLYLPVFAKELKAKVPVLKTEFSRNAAVLSVSATEGLRGAGGSQGTMTTAGEEEKSLMLRYVGVDLDYIKTMQMEIVQGRDFSAEFATDTISSVILNETAVAEMGWENPLGKEFKQGEDEPNLKVIGIVKDYHFYTLHRKIEPLIMFNSLDRLNFMVMRISPENINETIAYLEQVWNTHVPNRPFEYAFLDEHFDDLYKAEINRGKLYASFSMIAILIASLGLFGLASYMAEQKTKEIGIRKVLGATVPNIVLMLVREFAKLVAVSTIIGLPAAFFLMRDWLENFVYHTSIHWLTFVISGLIVLLIAILTVSYQAMKASVSNPIEALKYE